MWWTAGRFGVGLLAAGAVAGCSSAPDVPFGVRATETVWCADADGVVDTVTWQGHDGPLTELDVQVVALGAGEVSEDELLDACAQRFGWLTGATLCEAYAGAESLERFVVTEFVSERHGEIGPDRPGFPVVVRDRVSCEEVQLEAPTEADEAPMADRLRDWDAPQGFNDWRAQEAMWRDATDAGCLDIHQARELALTAQVELDGDWPVFETAHDPEDRSHDGLCLDVRLQREGFIEVSYHAVETPGGRSSPTDDITDSVETDAATDM